MEDEVNYLAKKWSQIQDNALKQPTPVIYIANLLCITCCGISEYQTLKQHHRLIERLAAKQVSLWTFLTKFLPSYPICLNRSIPMAIYAFLPSLALLNGVSIFPKVSEPWFLLYLFLFLGGYGQDLLDFIIEEGTFKKWWNDQRIWMIRGLSCFLIGSIEYFLKSLGISTHGFDVTSKVVDQEQSKRYEQGVFDFGVESPMFVPMTMAAITNLAAFCLGLVVVLTGRESAFEGIFMQVLISGFGVLNSLPVYEAMITSSKRGIPTRTTLLSVVLSSVLFVAAFVASRK